MATREDLGRRLRTARFERNLTLKEVARRSGMSATHISEVERGRTSPTIGALQRIAAALGESPATFVREDGLPRVALTRKSERETYYVQDADGRPTQRELISKGVPCGSMQVQRYVLGPSEKIHKGALLGEAFLLVLGGMLRLSFSEDDIVLREGDTAQFQIGNGFLAENVGEESCEVLGVLATPTRTGL